MLTAHGTPPTVRSQALRSGLPEGADTRAHELPFAQALGRCASSDTVRALLRATPVIQQLTEAAWEGILHPDNNCFIWIFLRLL